jgi:hypothetical protein
VSGETLYVAVEEPRPKRTQVAPFDLRATLRATRVRARDAVIDQDKLGPRRNPVGSGIVGLVFMCGSNREQPPSQER